MSIQEELTRLTQAKDEIRGALDRLNVTYTTDKLDDLSDAVSSIQVVTATQEGETITVPVGYIAEEQQFDCATSDLSAGHIVNDSGNLYFQATGSTELVALTDLYIPQTGVGAPDYSCELGVDTSDATVVTAADVGEGLVFYNADGRQVGTMGESTITISGGNIQVTAGRVLEGYTESLGTAEYTVNNNIVTISQGYWSGDPITVGTAVSGYTVTPGTEEQRIAKGSYILDDVIIEGDVNLISANIKKGATIFGVAGDVETGTDTSDATATDSDVSAGLVFYNASGRQTGTLSDVTATLDGNTVTVPAGRIRTEQTLTVPSGSVTVNEDQSKVIITEGYVQSGEIEISSGGGGGADVTLGQIDADGNFQPLSFVGTEASNSGDPETVENYYGWNGVLPVPDEGIKVGEAVEYYKCASVDTTAKTWTGYKAVLTDGVYSFEETVTPGLSYGGGLTPSINGIYSSDALVKISLLWTGVDPSLVFWASLSSDLTTAETGQALTKNGNVTFSNEKAVFEGSDYIEVTDTTGFPFEGSPFTLHAKVTFTNDIANFNHILSFGDCVGIRAYDGNLLAFTSGGDIRKYGINTGVEYKTDITYDGSTLKIYVDGVLAEETSMSLNIGSGSLTIGRGDGYNGTGSVRDVKLFTRALSADEIAAL